MGSNAKKPTPFNSPPKMIPMSSIITGSLPKNCHSDGHDSSGSFTIAIVDAEKLPRHDDSIQSLYPVNISQKQNINSTGFRKTDGVGQQEFVAENIVNTEDTMGHDDYTASIHDDDDDEAFETTTAKTDDESCYFSRRMSSRFITRIRQPSSSSPKACSGKENKSDSIFTTGTTASVTNDDSPRTTIRKFASIYNIESILAKGDSDRFLKRLVEVNTKHQIAEIPMCNKEAVLKEYFRGIKRNQHDVVKECLKRFTNYSVDDLWEIGTTKFDMFTLAVILEAKIRNTKLPSKPCQNHKAYISVDPAFCGRCGNVRKIACDTCDRRWCVDASCMEEYKKKGEKFCFLTTQCLRCQRPRHDDIVTETPAGCCMCCVDPKIEFMTHTM